MAASDLQSRLRALAEAELSRLEADSKETYASGTIKPADLAKLAKLIEGLGTDDSPERAGSADGLQRLTVDELRVLVSLMNKARGRDVDLRASVSLDAAKAIAYAAAVSVEAVQPLPVPRSLDQDEADALVAEYKAGNHSIARLARSYGVGAGAVVAFLHGAGIAVKARR